MRGSKIPSLAEASHRLRLLHIEIDATIRRLAWGEELSDQHITAFNAAICEADKIGAMFMKEIAAMRERRSYLSSNEQINEQLEVIQRMAARNGNGHVNGSR
jgi:hypothetical protein